MIQYLWAKTAKEGTDGYHSLLLHLLDVAASADAILGLSWEEARPWILLLVAHQDLEHLEGNHEAIDREDWVHVREEVFDGSWRLAA